MQTYTSEWKPGDPLDCDERNAVIVPGSLVRIAATSWGIPSGPTPELTQKFSLNVGWNTQITPSMLPIGIVVARSGDAKKGRHAVCVLLSREDRIAWFRVRDTIVLQSP